MNFLLVPLLAFLDTFLGESSFKVPARGSYWFAALSLILVGVGHFLHIPLLLAYGALLGAVTFYRQLGFRGGSLAPTKKQIPATIIRHAWSFVIALPLIFLFKTALIPTLVGMGIYTVAATLLAIKHRELADKRAIELAQLPEQEDEKLDDPNQKIEITRGAILGLVIAVILTFFVT